MNRLGVKQNTFYGNCLRIIISESHDLMPNKTLIKEKEEFKSVTLKFSAGFVKSKRRKIINHHMVFNNSKLSRFLK